MSTVDGGRSVAFHLQNRRPSSDNYLSSTDRNYKICHRIIPRLVGEMLVQQLVDHAEPNNVPHDVLRHAGRDRVLEGHS